MTILKHRHRGDEFAEARTEAFAVPPRPTDEFHPAYPGVAADALAWLRAQDAPVPPTAIRTAHDRTTWLPAVIGLRSVDVHRLPIDDIDTVLADIAAMVERAPFARHEAAVHAALAPVQQLLAEVTV